MPDPRIHVAFRFHVNLYHSYRGDTPDEVGFGKDIRIIRHTLDVLDRLNAEGIPARGTWDFDNVFSLEAQLPRHAPDIIASIQRRVTEGVDEVHVMAYNNGLIAAHTAAEFDAAIGRALTNEQGSGIADLFTEVYPMVRPQEMMMTPSHLRLYPGHGIEAVSLFYSAVPFNAFSTFVKPLPFTWRYNPLTLTYPGLEGSMTLMPTYNHGDIADHLSLQRWVRRMRRRQMGQDEPADLLLLIDADADDAFWTGYGWPLVSRLLATAGGLEPLVRSIADLPYVTFTRPGDYLDAHEPVGALTLGADTADGSFDGYASWAEKWSNHWLWTGIERARLLAYQAEHLLARQPSAEDSDAAQAIQHDLRTAFEGRLRALSTTHFGLAAPVMHRERLATARAIVENAVTHAARARQRAIALALPNTPDDETAFSIANYVRGHSTPAVTYRAKPARGLVRIPLQPDWRQRMPDADAQTLVDEAGHKRPAAILNHGDRAELLYVEVMAPEDRHTYRMEAVPDARGSGHVTVSERAIGNETLTLHFDDILQPVDLTVGSASTSLSPFIESAVRFRGQIATVTRWQLVDRAQAADGHIGWVITEGHLDLPTRPVRQVTVRRQYLIADGCPHLYVTTEVSYPATGPARVRADLARQLQRSYDARWQAVMPCEIRPALHLRDGEPLRIWKHNYVGDVTHYDLDAAIVRRSGATAAINNHVTSGWVAVSDHEQGLLVAQSAEDAVSMAFCPLRLERDGGNLTLRMNPFGSYTGPQRRYPTAETGLGRRVAVWMAETLRPHGPSYAGHSERFSLLIAPYPGDAPPDSLQADAEAFAYPHLLIPHAPWIAQPRTLRWPDDATDRALIPARYQIGQTR